jgi:hypothetical protein
LSRPWIRIPPHQRNSRNRVDVVFVGTTVGLVLRTTAKLGFVIRGSSNRAAAHISLTDTNHVAAVVLSPNPRVTA